MVSLYQTKKTNNNITNNSLSGSIVNIFYNRYFKYPFYQKETPRCICLSGVLTLEAAVIIPLLASFFVSILFFFRIMQVQLVVQKALDDTGRKMAVYMSIGEEKWSQATGITLSKALLSKELKGNRIVEKYVDGSSLGISLAESELEGDHVDLFAVYHIRFPVRLLNRMDIRVVQRVKSRKWTGWHIGGQNGEDDIWVFITETGTVYHTMETCTHLTLSITSVEIQKIPEMRNEGGGKYQECHLCEPQNENQKRVYITNQGDRYHYDLNCSGIKRTVSMIRLSEAGNRRMCSKCKEMEG